MSSLDSVLTQLFAKNTVTLPVLGQDVAVKKVTLRTLKPVTALIALFLEDLKITADNLPSVDLQNPALILKLISNYYEKVLEIVVSLSSVSIDQLLDMDTDESVLLIQAIIVLNKDFFMKKVLPNLQLIHAQVSS